MPACEKCGWDPQAVQFKPYENAMSVYINTLTGAPCVIKDQADEVMIGPEGRKILYVLKTKYAQWKINNPVVIDSALSNDTTPGTLLAPGVFQPTIQSFGPQPTTSEDSVTIINPMGVLEQKPLSALPQVQYAEPAPSAPVTPKPSPFDGLTSKA